MGPKCQKMVVMLDPRGLIGRGGSAVVSRHQEYSELLRRSTKDKSQLVILTLTPKVDSISELPATIVSFSSIVTWVLGSLSFLSQNRSRIHLFVAGNPWESFWVTWLLKIFLNVKARIQVQFHGDFCGPRWKLMSRKNRIRFYSLPVVLSLCDGVRFVGKRQQSNAIEMFPFLSEFSFLAPIPFLLGEFHENSFDPSEHFTVGVVGRIHKEKGLDAALRFIRCLSQFNYSFSVILVGDGEERAWIEDELAELKIDFQLTGHITGVELESAWRTIDVVLSMAPVESYGLVSREALSRGKRVIATRSGGIEELNSEIPAGVGLEVLPENWDCDSANVAMEQLKLHRPTPETQEFFSLQTRESLNRLIASWT
jgi:glycosyltransferase involved in cell wall biosynthesis